MPTFLLIVIGILLLITTFIIYYLLKVLNKNNKEQINQQIISQRLDNLNQHLSSNLNEVTKNLLNQLNNVTKQVNERLKENSNVLERSHRTIGERLDNAAKSYAAVTGKLAKLEESNRQIYEVGKDIASLQEILRAPKLRGTLGELFLGDLLSQVFSKDHFTLQHTFKNGQKIDAIIRLQDNYLVPIDAKFPLENFKKIIQAQSEEERKVSRKTFLNDVKKHISDISNKYILPDEGTIDFALMYIPAENIYYEIMIKDESDQNIIQFALNKRVFPVSPNTFYVYLQSILLGLKGYKIQEKAKEIWQHLGRLRQDFKQFSEQFDLVGRHLTHAKNSYDYSDKYLEKFSNKLEIAAKGEQTPTVIEEVNQLKLTDNN